MAAPRRVTKSQPMFAGRTATRANTTKKRVQESIAEAEGPAEKKLKKTFSTQERPAILPKSTSLPSAVKTRKAFPAINNAPTKLLDVYVFGANQQGELGLGKEAGNKHVKRPRLNPHLAADKAGVVSIATGGMHCAVLTRDNRILTWGVNDNAALGRDTSWDGGLVDMNGKDDDNESEEDEMSINPYEAMPTEIDTSTIPDGTIFTQLIATDNATFALTQTGLVFGWGTFRGSEGPFGFSPGVSIQKQAAQVQGLTNVVKLAAGSNHVLALTSVGAVHAWGSGEQAQLGRRVMQRYKETSLRPRDTLFRSGIIDIGCGSDHSFAMHKNGKLYSWGLNKYGQTGVAAGAGEDEGFVGNPTVVASPLAATEIACIGGGNHHSIAIGKDGTCWTWGRLDGRALGHTIDNLAESCLVRDEHGTARIVKTPQRLPSLSNIVFATAASDHCIAIRATGESFSWGFSSEYQTGLGTDADVETPTLIDNTATRGKKLVWAGAGGQYSVIAGLSNDINSISSST